MGRGERYKDRFFVDDVIEEDTEKTCDDILIFITLRK